LLYWRKIAVVGKKEEIIQLFLPHLSWSFAASECGGMPSWMEIALGIVCPLY
jgi:hypothetical protein